MSGVHETWKVEEHQSLVSLGEGLLTVQGVITMPLGKFPRRMTVAALEGGRGTVVYSAIALQEPEMRQIEALGEPAFLVVPNAHHRKDAKIWKQRYPKMRVVAPSAGRKDIEEVVAVDSVDGDGVDDSRIKIAAVGGTENSELAMLVSRADGTTLVVNDIIAHVAHPDGVGAQVMTRLMGFGIHHPQVPSVVKHYLVKDKAAVAAQFRRWAALPDVRRIVPSHGDVIEQPKPALELLAESLGY
jgi:hypothetical protein